MRLLAQISHSIKHCRLCPVSTQEAHGLPTPFSGTPDSGLFLVFRNPGIQEMYGGVPCIGKTKSYVDRFLRALCLSRDNTIIANLMNCYTKADRYPSDDEIAICAKTHLIPLIRECKPRVIVAFGKQTINFLSGGRIPSPRVKDRTVTLVVEGRDIPIISAEHPGVFLRNPGMIINWYAALMYVSLKLDLKFRKEIFPEFKEVEK